MAAAPPIKVLLVEDNPGDARLLSEALGEAGKGQFEVVHVDRLSEGLREIGANPFDIVLLDLGLPDGRGLETFLHAHREAPGSPIVVLTGLKDETVGLAAVQAGAQDFLIKGQSESPLLVRTLRYAVERFRREQSDAMRKNQTTHLWHSLFRTLGQGASAILYQAGMEAGSATYDFVTATWKPRDEAAFLRELGDYFRTAGLCRIRDISVNRAGVRLLAHIEGNSESAQDENASGGPVCHFLRGILCGIGQRVLGAPDLVCDEVTCQATGGETCEFLVHVMFA